MSDQKDQNCDDKHRISESHKEHGIREIPKQPPSASNVLLDDFEAELVKHQKVQQSVTNGAFEVTSMDYDPEKEKAEKEAEAFKGSIKKFHAQALNLQCSPDILDIVDSRATPENVTSFKDYMNLKDQVAAQKISDTETDEVISEDDLYYQQLLAEREIQRLQKLPNLASELNKCIGNTYSTTAVRSEDLLNKVNSDDFDKSVMQLNIYKEPIYALILNVDKQWVRSLVEEVLSSWEVNTTATNVVEKYVASLRGGSLDGVDMQKEMAALCEVLPDHIKDEESPLLYKAFCAVSIITKQVTEDDFLSPDFADKLLTNAEVGTAFAANITTSMKDGEPFNAAVHNAAEDAVENEITDDKSLDKAVILFTKVLEGKASANGKFEEFISNSVSKDVYDEYLAAKSVFDERARNRKEEKLVRCKESYEEKRASWEERRVQKDAIKNEQIELKHQREMQEMDRQIERAQKEAQLNQAQSQLQQSSVQQTSQQPYQQPTSDNQRFGWGRNNNTYGNTYYDRRGNGYDTGFGSLRNQNRYGGVNYGSQGIPLILVGVLVNIILGLLSYIAMKGFLAVVAIVGLGISLVGFYKSHIHEQGAMLVIALGYIVFVIAILLNFMR